MDRSIGSLWKAQTKKAKKNTVSLKIYFLLHFLSNLIQIFKVYPLLNFKSCEIKTFFILRKMSPLFSKWGWFFLNFKLSFFIFQFLKNCITQKLLNYLRNTSWKFKVLSLKNLEDRFLVILKISEKIDNEKLPFIRLYKKHFYKVTISQIFLKFCKNNLYLINLALYISHC